MANVQTISSSSDDDDDDVQGFVSGGYFKQGFLTADIQSSSTPRPDHRNNTLQDDHLVSSRKRRRSRDEPVSSCSSSGQKRIRHSSSTDSEPEVFYRREMPSGSFGVLSQPENESIRSRQDKVSKETISHSMPSSASKDGAVRYSNQPSVLETTSPTFNSRPHIARLSSVQDVVEVSSGSDSDDASMLEDSQLVILSKIPCVNDKEVQRTASGLSGEVREKTGSDLFPSQQCLGNTSDLNRERSKDNRLVDDEPYVRLHSVGNRTSASLQVSVPRHLYADVKRLDNDGEHEGNFVHTNNLTRDHRPPLTQGKFFPSLKLPVVLASCDNETGSPCQNLSPSANRSTLGNQSSNRRLLANDEYADNGDWQILHQRCDETSTVKTQEPSGGSVSVQPLSTGLNQSLGVCAGEPFWSDEDLFEEYALSQADDDVTRAFERDDRGPDKDPAAVDGGRPKAAIGEIFYESGISKATKPKDDVLYSQQDDCIMIDDSDDEIFANLTQSFVNPLAACHDADDSDATNGGWNDDDDDDIDATLLQVDESCYIVSPRDVSKYDVKVDFEDQYVSAEAEHSEAEESQSLISMVGHESKPMPWKNIKLDDEDLAVDPLCKFEDGDVRLQNDLRTGDADKKETRTAVCQTSDIEDDIPIGQLVDWPLRNRKRLLQRKQPVGRNYDEDSDEEDDARDLPKFDLHESRLVHLKMDRLRIEPRREILEVEVEEEEEEDEDDLVEPLEKSDHSSLYPQQSKNIQMSHVEDYEQGHESTTVNKYNYLDDLENSERVQKFYTDECGLPWLSKTSPVKIKSCLPSSMPKKRRMTRVISPRASKTSAECSTSTDQSVKIAQLRQNRPSVMKTSTKSRSRRANVDRDAEVDRGIEQAKIAMKERAKLAKESAATAVKEASDLPKPAKIDCRRRTGPHVSVSTREQSTTTLPSVVADSAKELHKKEPASKVSAPEPQYVSVLDSLLGPIQDKGLAVKKPETNASDVFKLPFDVGSRVPKATGAKRRQQVGNSVQTSEPHSKQNQPKRDENKSQFSSEKTKSKESSRDRSKEISAEHRGKDDSRVKAGTSGVSSSKYRETSRNQGRCDASKSSSTTQSRTSVTTQLPSAKPSSSSASFKSSSKTSESNRAVSKSYVTSKSSSSSSLLSASHFSKSAVPATSKSLSELLSVAQKSSTSTHRSSTGAHRSSSGTHASSSGTRVSLSGTHSSSSGTRVSLSGAHASSSGTRSSSSFTTISSKNKYLKPATTESSSALRPEDNGEYKARSSKSSRNVGKELQGSVSGIETDGQKDRRKETASRKICGSKEDSIRPWPRDRHRPENLPSTSRAAGSPEALNSESANFKNRTINSDAMGRRESDISGAEIPSGENARSETTSLISRVPESDPEEQRKIIETAEDLPPGTDAVESPQALNSPSTSKAETPIDPGVVESREPEMLVQPAEALSSTSVTVVVTEENVDSNTAQQVGNAEGCSDVSASVFREPLAPLPERNSRKEFESVTLSQVVRKSMSKTAPELPPAIPVFSDFKIAKQTAPSGHGTMKKTSESRQLSDLPRAKVDVNAVLSQDAFLLRILCWNPAWMKECETAKSPPPIVQYDKVFPLLDSYDSFSDYADIMQPLMLLEIWESMLRDFKENARFSRRPCKVLPTFLNIQKERKFLLLHCQGVITEEEFRSGRHLKESDLVVINLNVMAVPAKGMPFDQKTLVVKPVFGLVDKVAKHFLPLKSENTIHPKVVDLHKSAGNRSVFITYVIQLAYRKHPIDNQEFVTVELVTSLLPAIRQFSGLANLPRSPMAAEVLRPTQWEVFHHKLQVNTSKVKDRFNTSQCDAIGKITKAVTDSYYPPKICLLQGPPGTGKSFTITGLIEQILSEMNNVHILLCAPSNAGIDELCRRLIARNNTEKAAGRRQVNFVRLGAISSIHKDVQEHSLLHLAKKKHSTQENVPGSVANSLKTLERQIEDLKARLESCGSAEESEGLALELRRVESKKAMIVRGPRKNMSPVEETRLKKEILMKADVVCSTLNHSGSQHVVDMMRLEGGGVTGHFGCIIIDEACQCTEVDCLIPLQYRASKLVLVGDPEQLPPTVLSKKASSMNYGQSLFERLHSRLTIRESNPTLMLTTQYRMHPEICLFSSKHFYRSLVKTDLNTETKRSMFRSYPYTVFDLQYTKEKIDPSGLSTNNPAEANFVIDLCIYLSSLMTVERAARNIGIITPYQSQRMAIINLLQQRCPALGSIEVGTVDGFQGREKDVIIVSCVRANPSGNIGFLSDRRRMNVSITRAKYALYAVGNMKTLMTNVDWQALCNNARQRGRLVHVSSADQSASLIRLGCGQS